MPVELREHQQKALAQLGNGKILHGGVGSGKTIVAGAYYVAQESPKDIIVITTAKKRDSRDWPTEMAKFGIGSERGATVGGVLTVDSWNNIGRYVDTEGCFFVFDEQRLVGTGAWVRSFQKIAKKNRWIMLSATPGDNWLDYIPVFVANGWYKNATEFKRKHVIYAPFVKFPIVTGYMNEFKLELMRNELLVEMPFDRHTNRFMNYLDVSYDKEAWDKAVKSRWNPFTDAPMKDVNELFRVVRRIVNSDPSRLEMVRKLMRCHDKMIIFYNFNYELDMLRTLASEITVAEWNGKRKQPIPDTDRWIYLVQYTSGAEGWNCTETDAMILWSLTYSYKNFEQALGRIDRLDTPFTNLYYYIFGSSSNICRAVRAKLDNKESFNEMKYLREMGYGALPGI